MPNEPASSREILVYHLLTNICRVTGRGRIGADGLAFWFTAAKGTTGIFINQGEIFSNKNLSCFV